LFAPGARIAAEGFALKEGYAARLRDSAEDMAKFEQARRIFFKDGKPLKAGDILKQPDLAKTYRILEKQGADWFYRGAFAQSAEAWMKSHGGILTAAD